MADPEGSFQQVRWLRGRQEVAKYQAREVQGAGPRCSSGARWDREFDPSLASSHVIAGGQMCSFVISTRSSRRSAEKQTLLSIPRLCHLLVAFVFRIKRIRNS